MTTPNTPHTRPRLIELTDLERSLSSDHGPLGVNLAIWAIETVSAKALEVTRRDWHTPSDVPAGAGATIGLATRRLYTNPDRFNRESEGDYSYGLDATVTKADIFTPGELADLRQYAKRRTRPTGIGTLSTYRGDVGEPRTRYVPDGTADGLPWYGDDVYDWR